MQVGRSKAEAEAAEFSCTCGASDVPMELRKSELEEIEAQDVSAAERYLLMVEWGKIMYQREMSGMLANCVCSGRPWTTVPAVSTPQP
jgi:hypothetical protein